MKTDKEKKFEEVLELIDRLSKNGLRRVILFLYWSLLKEYFQMLPARYACWMWERDNGHKSNIWVFIVRYTRWMWGRGYD